MKKAPMLSVHTETEKKEEITRDGVNAGFVIQLRFLG